MAELDFVRARQGDTLDALLWRERALSIGDARIVLAANPGLAGLGAELPLGTIVRLPAIAAPAAPIRATVQLWD